MPSELFVVGLNWRSAPVSVREKLAFADGDIPPALGELCERSLIDEAVILSTCNRVEIYGCTSKTAPSSAVAKAAAEVRSWLSGNRHYPNEKLSEVLYEHLDNDAIRHIFRVSSALDSMVVGESQILGQLKAAFGTAAENRAIGPVLGRCLERSFSVAKRVRTETGISRGAANVSSVAVELAKRVFGDLYGKNVLVVGAGKMSVLAARHLRADGAGMITVTNRSPEKAEKLAGEIDGLARPWEDLQDELIKADVVISSTGAREPVLTKKLMKKVMSKRRYRSLVLIDIAVPRDIEDAVGRLDGAYLFDIDDLERMVAENLKERSKEADAAQLIVDAELHEFSSWLKRQRVVPTIRALREKFHDLAMQEVDKNMRNIHAATSEAEREQAVRRMTQVLANKLLHAPMAALKSDSDVEELAEATQRLFHLGDGEEQGQGENAKLKDAGLQKAVESTSKKG